MTDSFDPGSDLQLDCHTCLAANTTACNDCVVTHLLANDDGPIRFTVTEVHPMDHVVVESAERADPAHDADVTAALSLLAKAGLLDDDPVWVDRCEFDQGVLTATS